MATARSTGVVMALLTAAAAAAQAPAPAEAEGRAAVRRLQLELKQRGRASQGERLAAAAPADGVQVSFKLDPRVTKSLYMGERWVAGPAYSSATAPEDEVITVEARARRAGAGAAGRIRPTWSASDPEMVTITPAQGDEVKLTVRAAGESTVMVNQGELSTTIAVRTVRNAGRWRVDLEVGRASTADSVSPAAGAPAAREEK